MMIIGLQTISNILTFASGTWTRALTSERNFAMEQAAGNLELERGTRRAWSPLPTKSMTQTQIGTIGEVTVAAQLMLASDGRFSPFLLRTQGPGRSILVGSKTVSGTSSRSH